ncbi:MAG: hypothetical protein IV100_10045 [Myxococcales bacterium]|nr:hypothetical protein [Myxococcales bacterium]
MTASRSSLRRLLLLAALFGSACGSPAVISTGDSDTGALGGVCEPGDAWCNGGKLLKCRADGTDVFETVCDYGCFDGACRDGACVDGSVRCGGPTLKETCQNAEWVSTVCDQGCMNGECVAQVCAAGRELCEPDGSKVVRCSADGLVLEHVETCPFGCDGATATCLPAVCDDGDLRCGAAAQPERCRVDRRGFEAFGEPCAESCAAGECLVSACKAGEKRCGAVGVETCNSAGSAFTKTETCEWGCLAGPSGGAECAQCFPDAHRCSGNTIEYCETPFAPWVAVKECAPIQTCANGQCADVLKLEGGATLDSVRLLLTEALAECWMQMLTKSKQETGDRYICRGLDTLGLTGDIGQAELVSWFCDNAGEGLGESDFTTAELFDAASDVMGCGTLDWLDLTVDTLNQKVHAGVFTDECIAFDRPDKEILVAPCEELKQE